jgi:hypothetical protein
MKLFERVESMFLTAWARTCIGTGGGRQRKLGMEEGAVRVAVHRLRKRYRQLLRDEIAQTLSDAAQTWTRRCVRIVRGVWFLNISSNLPDAQFLLILACGFHLAAQGKLGSVLSRFETEAVLSYPNSSY